MALQLSNDGPIRESNLAWLLWQAGATVGDRTAIVEKHTECNYAALADKAGAVGVALRSVGAGPNDRVALFLERGADAAAAVFGALSIGSILVLVNELLRPRQVEHILRHSGARVLVSSARLLSRQPRTLDVANTSLVMIEDIPTAGGLRPIDRIGSDAAQIIYTSGSEGKPKGATFGHGALWASVGTIASYLGIEPGDRIASLMSFSYSYGFNQLLCAVHRGAALIVEDSTLTRTLVKNLREREVSVLAGVPSLWLQLLDVPEFRDEPVKSLRLLTNAGGHLPPSAVRLLRRAQPQARLFLMYGMTEVIRSSYLDPSEVDDRPDSMGRAMPGSEVMVLREDLSPCDPGEVGELVHRGPTIAMGYWGDHSGTDRVFRPNPLIPPDLPRRERVVFSGDLVKRDAEGFLYFVSRRDRLIKTLGYRVGPDEITDVLHASGEVCDAVVLPEVDPARGQRIVAHVVLKRTQGAMNRLEKFCWLELPSYMYPARFETHDSLPRLANGKHDLEALRKRS